MTNETTKKFEIGSLWKIRLGWMVVVVDVTDKYIMVYHSNDNFVGQHDLDGRYNGNEIDEFDLIEPWVEPNQVPEIGKIYRVETAIEHLRNHQRQLDMDGCEVGVSRQALDEVLNYISRTSAIADGVGVEYIPVGYQYGFTCPFGGDGIVWRDRPDEWNGNRPVHKRQIFTPPQAATDEGCDEHL